MQRSPGPTAGRMAGGAVEDAENSQTDQGRNDDDLHYYEGPARHGGSVSFQQSGLR